MYESHFEVWSILYLNLWEVKWVDKGFIGRQWKTYTVQNNKRYTNLSSDLFHRYGVHNVEDWLRPSTIRLYQCTLEMLWGRQIGVGGLVGGWAEFWATTTPPLLVQQVREWSHYHHDNHHHDGNNYGNHDVTTSTTTMTTTMMATMTTTLAATMTTMCMKPV